MLRSLVTKILWVLIFGLGRANDSFPPCIRINADLSKQDPFIHSNIINQAFTISQQDYNPKVPRYISNDGKYELKYCSGNTLKWRLFPKGQPSNEYLKAPALEDADGSSIRDPLLIEKDKWELYCGRNNCWESVTNPVTVVRDDDCPQSSEKRPYESDQEPELDSPEQVSNQQPQISNQPKQVSNQNERISNEQQGVSSQQPHVSNYLAVIPMFRDAHVHFDFDEFEGVFHFNTYPLITIPPNT